MIRFTTEEDLLDFIRSEIIVSTEAMGILGVSRVRLTALVQNGRISPVKAYMRERWFKKSDVIQLKQELDAYKSKMKVRVRA